MPRTKKRKAEPSRNGVVPHVPSETPSKEEKGRRLRGRLLSEVQTRDKEWLLHPWIPRGMLTMIVGLPNVGKSTFLAALVAYATGGAPMEEGVTPQKGRVVILPGFEEDVEVMTAPRLVRAGVLHDRVKLLEDSDIAIGRDKDRLAGILTSFEASVLLVDPIDSYMDDASKENDGPMVRAGLEAAAWIASKTNAAVVAVRHPGKDERNVMPGSRQWRAVPRVIVQLSADEATPGFYIISHYRDGLGTQSKPRHYTLEGDPGQPRRFKLLAEIDRSAEELARTLGGPVGRWKLMQACRLIRWHCTLEDSPTRERLGTEGRKLGLGEDTVNEAMRLLGVKSVPGDSRDAPWKLVRTQEQWPGWLPETTPP